MLVFTIVRAAATGGILPFKKDQNTIVPTAHLSVMNVKYDARTPLGSTPAFVRLRLTHQS